MRRLILTFLIFILPIIADEVDEMRNKVDLIEKNIKENESNISSSVAKQKSLLNQIEKIEKELNDIKQSYYETERKYQTINKNVGYAEQNIEVIDLEIYEATIHFEDTIASYDEYIYLNKSNLFFDEFDINNYFESEEMKDVLGTAYNTIENINSVKTEIREIRDEIASEKSQLEGLRRELANKKSDIERKKREQDRLIKQLRDNQSYYKNQIANLKREKLNVEKEIENIIKEKARLSGEYNTNLILKELGFIQMPSDGRVVVNYGQEKTRDVVSNAMEIKATLGARIKAANKGEVIFVGKLNNLGNVIMINHGYNFITIYGNLISSYVTVGDAVSKGQSIGVLGFSTNREPILYFETRLGTKSVDPRTFIKK